MLCQFTVKNYKSIRDEATFDMQAAAISEHEDRIIKDQDDEMYLPVSAIYGPNGGGKSNVLAALHTFCVRCMPQKTTKIRVFYKKELSLSHLLFQIAKMNQQSLNCISVQSLQSTDISCM